SLTLLLLVVQSGVSFNFEQGRKIVFWNRRRRSPLQCPSNTPDIPFDISRTKAETVDYTMDKDDEAKPHDECAERRDEVQSEPLGSDSEYPSGHSIQSQEILREEAYMESDKEEPECPFTDSFVELVSKIGRAS